MNSDGAAKGLHYKTITEESTSTTTATTIATATTTVPSQTQVQEEAEPFTPYIPDTYSVDYFTLPVTHIQLTETFPPTRGPNRVGLLQVDCHWMRPRQLTSSDTFEDGDEDADEDEDEDDDEDEEDDEDDDDRGNGLDDGSAPSAGTTTSEKGKGYNLRVDPPRRSTSRYT
ncbi:uncharacterized protein LOC130934481 [Arachis stenosperma]|uniref:uncharacterized protein LOC130934481 n=1 Tax=Arachis stenosperma TaxID=217475 RepID=UPI0025AD8551|nr:uncharacterized protein LOC130934481 [Arachis stenosperma]